MASVFDIATYILQSGGPMSADEVAEGRLLLPVLSFGRSAPSFDETIEAWATGPVIPALYDCHRGQFVVARLAKGDPATLSAEDQSTVDAVLNCYGDKSAHCLSDLTHKEDAWGNARKGLILASGRGVKSPSLKWLSITAAF